MTRADDFAQKAKEQVQLDIQNGFLEILASRDDAPFFFGLHECDLDAQQAIATADVLVAVPWKYPCTHVGTFMNIPATGVDFVLHGTTFVDVRGSEDSWIYYRYIDYIGALHQLGVSTEVRPVVAAAADS
jgi:hypothetical protein